MQEHQEEELKDLDRLIEYMDRYQKPVLIFGRGPERASDSPISKKLQENGIVMYPTPERAAKTLAHLVQYSNYLHGR